MPINYGSNFPLAELTSVEVGIPVVISKSSLSWLSTFLNVIEIGATLLFGPEVGTIFALANATAQTEITYQETGEVDPLEAGLQFGSVIIPGIIQGVKNSLQARKFIKAGDELFTEGRTELISSLELGEDGSNAISKIKQGTLGKQIGEKSNFFRSTDRTFNKYFKDNKDLYKSFKTKVSKASVSGVGETGSDISANVERKIFNVVSDETGLTFSEIKQLRGIIKDGKITNLKLYRSVLTKSISRTGNELLEAALAGTKSQKVLKLLTKSETRAMKMSRLSSKSIAWTTKVGGYITSPTSLAADAISKTVAKLTSKVEAIGEEIAEKMSKWIKAGSKGLEAAQDEFKRTGGTLFKSKWIMGYKTLQEDEVMSTILIQFKNQHPNIITKLSSSKLLEWIEYKSKGNWYINNIARSRGGRIAVGELGIEGELENLLGMLPVSKINEIVGFASFSESFVDQIRANSGTMIWHSGAYIEGFKEGIIQGVISEGIKAAVSLGTTNQYAKQVLEGGFGSVSSGTKFGVAFSTSFASGAQSMKDTVFEDTTKAGNVVKNVKVIQGTGSSVKGII